MSDFVTLRDHITIQKGKAPLVTGYSGPGAKPYLNPEYLRGRASAELAKPGSDAVHVRDGDTILLWDGSNAGEFFKGKSGLAASTMAKIKPDTRFNPAYFFHVTKHAETYLKNQTTGTGIPHVDRRLLEATRVFCPAPAEQLRLAETLDHLDTAIHETEAIFTKLRSIKHGLLHDLMTRGIAANGELRPPQIEAPHLYKESPLGWIPKEWDAVTLSACSVKIADRDHTTPRYIDDGVLIVSPTNLQGDEGIDFVSCKRISCRAHEINSKKTDLTPGDIILHRIGAGLGRVRLVTAEMPEFSILHSMAQIRPNLNVMTSNFMLWAMRIESTKSQMGLGTQSIGVPDLGLDKISNFIVPRPLLDEQRQIAARLVALQTRIDADSNDYAKLTTLKSGLMDDLLTGRVRVTSLLAEAAQQPGSA
jgi:type I restriction enzyme S subunit